MADERSARVKGLEEAIIGLVETNGPCTGAELRDRVGGDPLALWRVCTGSPALTVETVGRHYLRLDRNVDGFARLSPSILRGFLTFSVVGVSGDPGAVHRRAETVRAHMEAVSDSKRECAYRVVSAIAGRLGEDRVLEEHACVIIAGDIVYGMAHDVPRPERSTGKPVNGSDIDLVVMTDDLFPEPVMRRVDEAVYREKLRLLMTPHMREEIDYVVKRLARVREQARFDTFKRMVACKIIDEAVLLYGNRAIFDEARRMLDANGVSGMLARMEARAGRFRAEAEARLARGDAADLPGDTLHLFYPAEESEEFE